MKNLTYSLWLLALCVLSLTSCSRDSLAETESADLQTMIPVIEYSAIELEILDLVNDYRAANGFVQLDNLDAISWQAEGHNQHMIEKGEVCHDEFADRYSALVNTVKAKAVSENVAFGYRSAEAVVKAWIKSEGHRKNLEGDFTHFGISVEEDAVGKLYFTNIFVKK